MGRNATGPLVALAFLMFGCSEDSVAPAEPEAQPNPLAEQIAAGETVYEELCVGCHEGGVAKAPHISMLQIMSSDSILEALTNGVMQQESADLSAAEKEAVSVYLAGAALGTAEQFPVVACEGDAAAFDLNKPPQMTAWGFTRENTRTIPAEVASFSRDDVSKLKLKWAFAYPGANRARSQPIAAGGAVFVGSHNGKVYALDAETGCARWSFQASAEVRTAVVVSAWEAGDEAASPAAYFGDLLGNVYAVEALTGKLIWRQRADDHTSATITGTPSLHGGRLYVPVSSLEVTPAQSPDYPCCTYRGSVVAYDAKSGDVAWQTFTIDEEPKLRGQNASGTDQFGPSGAPIWNSPAIDAKRNQLYVGTGENYSSPATLTSDAILAIDLTTGAVNWTFQGTPNDVWNTACDSPTPDNCPPEGGPDFDFGAATMLATDRDGRDLVLGGQKSGMVHALDPDTGEIVWQQKVGRGGIQGGVHFGMAADGGVLFVPISDMEDGRKYPEPNRPGLYALDLTNGEYIWKHQHEEGLCGERQFCHPGISAAVSAVPGLVFAGAMEGHLRIHDAETGDVLWDYDTTGPIETISGETGRGGSIGGASSPLIVDGMMYFNSGYGIYLHMPGNVLFAFGVDDE